MLSCLAFVVATALQDPKIVFDTKQLENLTKFTKEAEVLAKAEYPKTADVLGIPRSSLADVKVIIDFNADGVAYADGLTIHVPRLILTILAWSFMNFAMWPSIIQSTTRFG